MWWCCYYVSHWILNLHPAGERILTGWLCECQHLGVGIFKGTIKQECLYIKFTLRLQLSSISVYFIVVAPAAEMPISLGRPTGWEPIHTTTSEQRRKFPSAYWWHIRKKVSFLNAISISLKHKVGGDPGRRWEGGRVKKTKGVTSHQASPLSGLIDFFKKTSNEHIAVELLIFWHRTTGNLYLHATPTPRW